MLWVRREGECSTESHSRTLDLCQIWGVRVEVSGHSQILLYPRNLVLFLTACPVETCAGPESTEVTSLPGSHRGGGSIRGAWKSEAGEGWGGLATSPSHESLRGLGSLWTLFYAPLK